MKINIMTNFEHDWVIKEEMWEIAKRKVLEETTQLESFVKLCVDYCTAQKDISWQFAGPYGRYALEQIARGFDPATLEPEWVEMGRIAKAHLSERDRFRFLSFKIADLRAVVRGWERLEEHLLNEMHTFSLQHQDAVGGEYYQMGLC